MKNLNEGQLAYYKALRKNQKRKRRENKRKGDRERNSRTKPGQQTKDTPT